MLKAATIQEINFLLERFPILQPLQNNMIKSVEELVDTFAEGGKLLICGNGGSAADSLHIAGELMKSFAKKRPISEAIADRLRQAYPDTAEYYISNLQGALPAISLVCLLYTSPGCGWSGSC